MSWRSPRRARRARRLAVVPSAAAHAVLLKTVPANDAVVEEQPDQVVLHFDEPVETALGSVRVYDGARQAGRRGDDLPAGPVERRRRDRPDARPRDVHRRVARHLRGLRPDQRRVRLPRPGARAAAGRDRGAGARGHAGARLDSLRRARALDYALLLLAAGGVLALTLVLTGAAPALRRRLYLLVACSRPRSYRSCSSSSCSRALPRAASASARRSTGRSSARWRAPASASTRSSAPGSAPPSPRRSSCSRASSTRLSLRAVELALAAGAARHTRRLGPRERQRRRSPSSPTSPTSWRRPRGREDLRSSCSRSCSRARSAGRSRAKPCHASRRSRSAPSAFSSSPARSTATCRCGCGTASGRRPTACSCSRRSPSSCRCSRSAPSTTVTPCRGSGRASPPPSSAAGSCAP